MLKAGKYTATAVDAGLSSTKNGNPQAFMKFSLTMEDGSTETITWFGGMTEKAVPHTVKALVNAGFMGNDFADLEKPFVTVFSPKKVQIELEDHTYNGKTSLQVKWVNKMSEGPKKYEGQTPRFAAAFAAYKKEAGIKSNPLLED
jgi:hypothetical protein